MPKLQNELLVSVKMDLGSNWLPLRVVGHALSITAGGNGGLSSRRSSETGMDLVHDLNQQEYGC